MEQMNREDRVTFELMERIPLEELSSNIAVIRNVEVTPEIEMIAEYSSYRILGSLIFTGEYEARKQGEATHPLLLDRSANYNKRLVRKINHRIPVDISLPADRIDDEGVVMEIISLDYDLAEPNQLIVTTGIELQGVYKEEVVKNAYWDQATQFDYTPRELEEDRIREQEKFRAELEYEQEKEQLESREYLFEAQPIKESQDNSSTPVYGTSEYDRNYSNIAHMLEGEQQTDLEVDAETGFFATNIEKRTEESNSEQIDLEEPNLENRTEDVQEQEIPIEEESIPTLSPIEEREPEVRVTISQKEHRVNPTIERKGSESSSEEEKQQSRSTTVSLLSKFLKNREETMTQIQMCLVQPGESLADIARRYNTQEDDILAMNNLTFNSNIGGKVLKIPVRRAR